MTLLRAAKIVRTLGMRHSINWRMGQTHVGTPNDKVAQEWRDRVTRAFKGKGKRKVGPELQALGKEACTEALVLYALAVHHRNGRLYRRVMRGF